MGDAEAIRATGEARAEAYKLGAEAMGSQGYTAVQLMQIIGERGVRVIPDIMVNGGNSGNGGLVEALLGIILRDQLGQQKSVVPTNGSTSVTVTPPSTLPEQ
jgi:uncharacterized membrane protein YqiK